MGCSPMSFLGLTAAGDVGAVGKKGINLLSCKQKMLS